MNKNDELIDSILSGLKKQQPKLANPQQMEEKIMHRIMQKPKPAPWLFPVRFTAIAASILLLCLLTFQSNNESITTEPNDIIAYQNQTLNKLQPPTDRNACINILQKRLCPKSTYELLKQKIYENKY